jgi:hypothetical protein
MTWKEIHWVITHNFCKGEIFYSNDIERSTYMYIQAQIDIDLDSEVRTRIIHTVLLWLTFRPYSFK